MTMSFEKVLGQSRSKRFLQQVARTGHLPHALLFSGMEGIGKTALAFEFAKLVNCLEFDGLDACDRCASCRKADSGHHPDLLWVRSDGMFIKVDQIRELRRQTRFRPFEGRRRVIILADAQNLREEAGNALLKLLEEPPDRHLFILTVLEPQMLLPTIVSRCCHVRLQPLEDELIRDHLVARLDIPAPVARDVTRLCGGSLERARWLTEDGRLAHWKEILETAQRLRRLSFFDLFDLTARWALKKEDLEQDLECIKLWVRDLVLCRLSDSEASTFDLDDDLRRIARNLDAEDLFSLYDTIEQALQRFRLNANRQLTLEGVCLAIKDILNGQGSRNTLS